VRACAVIAVTHRISSLHLFDRILVMHQGKVSLALALALCLWLMGRCGVSSALARVRVPQLVGDGTHEQLLRENEHYQDLQKANNTEEPHHHHHHDHRLHPHQE
jgi:energy-coupling factor transporter ATP-binding protein EcfA2